MRKIVAVTGLALLLSGAAWGQVRMYEAQDKVYLNDGSTVEGTIVGEGLRGVKMLVVAPEEEADGADWDAPEAAREEQPAGTDGAEAALGDPLAGLDETAADIPMEERFIRRPDILRIVRGRRVTTKPQVFTTEQVNGVTRIVARQAEALPPEAGAVAEVPAEKPSVEETLKQLPDKVPSDVDEITAEHIKAIAAQDPQVKAMISFLGGPEEALSKIKKNPQYRGMVENWLKKNAGKSTGDALKKLQDEQNQREAQEDEDE